MEGTEKQGDKLVKLSTEQIKILKDIQKEIKNNVSSLLDFNKDSDETKSEKSQSDKEKLQLDKKTAKTLEDIRDEIKNGMGGGSTGSGLGGLITAGLLPLAGFVAGIAATTDAIKELYDWFKEGNIWNGFPGMFNEGTKGKQKIESATTQAFSSAAGAEVAKKTSKDIGNIKQNIKTATSSTKPAPTGTSPKITNIESKLPSQSVSPESLSEPKFTYDKSGNIVPKASSSPTMTSEPGGRVLIEEARVKNPMGTRALAAAKAVGGSAMFPVKTAARVGKSGLAGAAVGAGVSAILDFNNPNVDWTTLGVNTLKNAGAGLKTGLLFGAGESAAAGIATAIGAEGVAAAIPLIGQAYAAYELTKLAYSASDVGRTVAEEDTLNGLQLDLDRDKEKANKLIELAQFQEKSGAKEEAEKTMMEAVAITQNSGQSFAQWHNIIATHEKLDNVVDMDKAWGRGQKYSIEDVNTLITWSKKAEGNTAEEKLKWLMNDDNFGERTKNIVNNIGKSDSIKLLEQSPAILEDYNNILWKNPEKYWEKNENEIQQKAAAAKRIEERKEKQENFRQKRGSGSKFANEGILEGTKDGSPFVGGENYTPEAIISTKPNIVTEKIGHNLYEILKNKNDSDSNTSSTEKSATIILDALQNSLAEYVEMFKISPLQGNQQPTQIINNTVVGGGETGNGSNGQYFNSMMTTSNSENILQELLKNSYRAALL